MPKLFSFAEIGTDTPVLSLLELQKTVMPHIDFHHLSPEIVEVRWRGYMLLELDLYKRQAVLMADDHYEQINNILEFLKCDCKISQGKWVRR